MPLQFLRGLGDRSVGGVGVLGLQQLHRFRAEIDDIFGCAIHGKWQPGKALGGALHALLSSPNSFQRRWHSTHLVCLIDAHEVPNRKFSP